MIKLLRPKSLRSLEVIGSFLDLLSDEQKLTTINVALNQKLNTFAVIGRRQSTFKKTIFTQGWLHLYLRRGSRQQLHRKRKRTAKSKKYNDSVKTNSKKTCYAVNKTKFWSKRHNWIKLSYLIFIHHTSRIEFELMCLLVWLLSFSLCWLYKLKLILLPSNLVLKFLFWNPRDSSYLITNHILPHQSNYFYAPEASWN